MTSSCLARFFRRVRFKFGGFYSLEFVVHQVKIFDGRRRLDDNYNNVLKKIRFKKIGIGIGRRISLVE